MQQERDCGVLNDIANSAGETEAGKRRWEDELLYIALCFSCRDLPSHVCEDPQGLSGAQGDDGVSEMLCVGTGEPCSWGSRAAEQQQRLDLKISASEADEHTGGNTHVDGEITLGHCSEPFPGLGKV